MKSLQKVFKKKDHRTERQVPSRFWPGFLAVLATLALVVGAGVPGSAARPPGLQHTTFLPLIMNAPDLSPYYKTVDADVNGDRLVDQVWIGKQKITVALRRQDGTLSFMPAQPNPMNDKGDQEISSRDVNGDGREDVLWQAPRAAGPSWIGLGNPDGTLTFDKMAQGQLMVRVTINRVLGLDGIDWPGSDPDFYAIVNIDGTEFDNKPFAIDDDNDISPNWQFFTIVDSTRISAPVEIAIYDEDGGLRGDDDHVDIDPHDGRNLELIVNLSPCSVIGDVTGSCSTSLTSVGAESDRAQIWFTIDVGPVAPVNVKATIEHVHALDCFDEVWFTCPSDPDFYAALTIDGQAMDNRDQNAEDDDDIYPNWEFGKLVDFNKGNISLTLDIFDSDGGLRGDDDQADLKPAAGRTLNLNVDLTACLMGSTSGVSGDVTGGCGQTLYSYGTEDDRAEIWFRIEVVPPATTAGTNVRCLHSPIWPQGSAAVSITVDALDGALAPKSVMTNIEVWLNNTSAPFATVSNTTNLTVNAGTYTAGSNFTYGCLVRDSLSGEVVFSGWRRVQVGMPPDGHAVPVLYTGPRASRVDTVFIRDQDTYTTTTSTMFQADIYNLLWSGYYSERVFLFNQDKMNFWIALDQGDAQDDCASTAPGNWDHDYTFSDTGAIIHRDGTIRDCTPGGARFFSSKATSTRIVLHESGHQPYGLADEYCCDGGYFQPDPYPNLCAEQSGCVAEIPDLQTWDTRLGVTPRTTASCTSLTSVGGDDWWTSDSRVNDLMMNNSTPQGADYRRIQWIFDRCAAASCNPVSSLAAGPWASQPPAVTPQAVDPRVEPVPVFDYNDLTKSVVVRLNFASMTQVSLGSTSVTYGQPYARLGDPPLLRVKLYDQDNHLAEEFNSWHPMWAFVWQGYRESRQIRAGLPGRFIFPFQPTLKRAEFIDIPTSNTLITVDLQPAIDAFCADHPTDPECLADLSVTKADHPDPVVAGTTLTYTLIVTNSGPVAATGVILTDSLPARLVFDSAASSPECTAVTSTVTCNLGDLPDTTSRTVTIVVVVDPATPDNTIVTNTAFVSANQSDPDLSDNATEQDTTVIRRTDLSVAKVSSATQVHIGESLTYTITVTNHGPSVASGVILTDSLPLGVSFMSATTSHGSGCGLVGGNLVCNLGSLAVGQTTTVTILTTVGCNAAEMTNVAEVAGNETDPNLTNNHASAIATLLADYGDASDPPYSTKLANGGAYHCDASNEWLGLDVDYEPDAVFPDPHDDGVLLEPPHHQSPILGQVTINTSGLKDGRYGVEPERRLYLRGWFDMNEDGDWDDPGELVIDCVLAPGTMGTCNGRPANWQNHLDRKFPVRFYGGPPIDHGGWLRFRLSYGTSVGPTGPALYGEVEDYGLNLDKGKP